MELEEEGRNWLILPLENKSPIMPGLGISFEGELFGSDEGRGERDEGEDQ